MKFFKSFDLFGQLTLLVIIGISAIIGDPETLSPLLFVLAFAGLQILSILVNLTYGNQAWKLTRWRKIHLIGTALVIAGIIVAMIQSSSARTGDKDDKYNMAGLETMIYITIPAIVIAIFYSVITFVEWKKIREIKQ